MDQSMDQLVKHTTGMGQLKMFSKDWYNEYFRLAANSPTHSHFCEQVYGQDLVMSILVLLPLYLQMLPDVHLATQNPHPFSGLGVHGVDQL